MGSDISKIDISIAEQGIRSRIERIDTIQVNMHFLYNTLNNTLNYIDDNGESMLENRLLEPSQIVLASECIYSVLKAIPSEMHIDVMRRFLTNMLEIHLHPEKFNIV